MDVASITIRNLDEDLKQRLRIRAAENGTSMEQEARDILRITLYARRPETRNLAEVIRSRFASFGGVDLKIPPREPMPEPPAFD